MNLKSSIDLSSEIHCVLDRQGFIIEANNSFKQVFQLPNYQLSEILFINLLAIEDRDNIQKLFFNLTCGRIQSFECKTLNGAQEPLQLKGRVVLSEQDCLHLVANVTILQDAHLARFRRFFDMSLLDIVVILDDTKKIIYANKDFSETLGYSWHEINNYTLHDFVYEDDKEKINMFFDKLIQDEGIALDFNNRCLHQNGEIKWIFWKAIYTKGHYYCIGHDITEIKVQEIKIQELLNSTIELNHQLEIRNEQLQTTADNLEITLNELEVRNFELDQFVYKVSHDLRAPLTSILGIINLAKLDNESISKLLDYFSLIERSIFKLDKFIRSLLEYSRGNRSELLVDKVDFQKIIDGSLDDLRYMKNYHLIDKQIYIQPDINFYSDALRLGILFNNIISNAIKYLSTARDKSFLKIHIVSTSPDKVELEFSDNGIGIKQEYLDSVFNMFFRASENSEGSGLGLYIVKQTVEKLNGTIVIESEYSAYTRIKISLPSLKSTNQ